MRQRYKRDPVLAAAMALFAAGLAVLAVMFGLFASGHRNLPMWLSVSSLLLPIGLTIGMVRTRRQSHSPQRQRDD